MKKYKFCSCQIEIICLLVGCFLTLSSGQVGAQIIPDGTLGAESSRINPINGLSDRIDGGAIRGSNLFHSFQRFDIGSGRGVFFSNPVGVTNIFSRVTGGVASNIDGILGINGASNLFLINPNGILFGSGASLNLKGSFVASTASSLIFPNDQRFSTTTPQPVPLLIVDSVAPIGLQFEANPGLIKLKNSHLSTQPAMTMALVGGDINIDNSSLTARLGSRLELGAIKDAGIISLAISRNEVRLKFPDNATRADISIKNSSSIRSIIKIANDALDPDEGAGVRLSGQIQLTGHNISLSNHSELVAESGLFIGPYDLKPTDIKINASGLLDLRKSSSIINLSGGNTIIQAKQISLVDKSQLINKVDAQPKYDSINEIIGVGGIDLKIDGEVNLQDSLIALEIKTSKSDLNMSGAPLLPYTPPPPRPGIPGVIDSIYYDDYLQNWYEKRSTETSRSYSIYNLDGSIRVAARTGNLDISAKSISLSDSAQIKINSSTELNQNSAVGNIKIDSRESVKIIGTKSGIFSRVSNSQDVAVGNIRMTGNALILKDGGQISTTVEGQVGTRYAGNIDLDFQKLLLLKNLSTITTSVGKNVQLIYSDQQGIQISRTPQGISVTDLAKASIVGAGNIQIKVPNGFIAAAGNSDIQANSYSGSGGRVSIDAQGVLGLVKRTREELTNVLNTTSPDDLDSSRLLTNDVIAISQENALLNGQVDIRSLNLDPGNGLNQVPKEPRATDVADSCQVSQGTETVQFYDIGRGGLPPRPEDPLSMDLIEWSSLITKARISLPQFLKIDEPIRTDMNDPDRTKPTDQASNIPPKLIPPCQSQ